MQELIDNYTNYMRVNPQYPPRGSQEKPNEIPMVSTREAMRTHLQQGWQPTIHPTQGLILRPQSDKPISPLINQET